jgi:hypothetical protein
MSYGTVPRSDQAIKADDRVCAVQKWHTDLHRPPKMTDTKYKTFVCYCTEFFIDGSHLWQKNRKGEHQLVIAQDRRLFILSSAHDDAGHHRYFATHAHIVLRYWWPFMGSDIAWFIKTCHLCQSRKTQNILIPLIIATPAPLFTKRRPANPFNGLPTYAQPPTQVPAPPGSSAWHHYGRNQWTPRYHQCDA